MSDDSLGLTFNSLTTEMAAIYAALPVLHNAIHGDLPALEACKWVQSILTKALPPSDPLR